MPNCSRPNLPDSFAPSLSQELDRQLTHDNGKLPPNQPAFTRLNSIDSCQDVASPLVAQ